MRYLVWKGVILDSELSVHSFPITHRNRLDWENGDMGRKMGWSEGSGVGGKDIKLIHKLLR